MNETGVNDKGVDHSSVNFKPYILSVEESIKYCENIALIDPNCSAVSFSWKKKPHTSLQKPCRAMQVFHLILKALCRILECMTFTIFVLQTSGAPLSVSLIGQQENLEIIVSSNPFLIVLCWPRGIIEI